MLKNHHVLPPPFVQLPLAATTEFQKVVYDAQQAMPRPAPLPSLPRGLLSDLARIGADPEIIIRYVPVQLQG
jgi:hypothetical protein